MYRTGKLDDRAAGQQDDSDVTKKTVILGSSARPAFLWRNLDYLLLAGGQALSSIGTQVSLLAFPLLMFALTNSAAQAGLMTALRGLPYILFSLPAGVLVDRWDRKRVMILCDSGRALALGSIPLAFAFGHLTLVQLYLVSMVEGTLFTLFSLAKVACLPRIVSKAQLPAATAQSMAVDALAGLLGPTLGGLLYSLGMIVPFLMDALTYLISVLALLFMKSAFQEERSPVIRKLWVEMREGLFWLWQHPLPRFLGLLTGGLNLCSFGFPLIIIVQARTMHASTFTIGLLFASGGLGSILGSLMASSLQKRLSFRQLMVGSTWIWALSWILFAIAPNVLVLGMANAIGFIIVPIYMGTQFSYLLALIPDTLQGRVNSVFRLMAFGVQPLSLALTGTLLQAAGPVSTVLILLLPQLVLALAATLNPYMRRADSRFE
jgi:MFS family permease